MLFVCCLQGHNVNIYIFSSCNDIKIVIKLLLLESCLVSTLFNVQINADDDVVVRLNVTITTIYTTTKIILHTIDGVCKRLLFTGFRCQCILPVNLHCKRGKFFGMSLGMSNTYK